MSFYQVERHIYGSARLGILTEATKMLGSEYTPYPMDFIGHTIGNRNYELNNHLGNVLSVVSDKVIPQQGGSSSDVYWLADIRQSTDYSPFGVTLEKRNMKLVDPVSGNPAHSAGSHPALFFFLPLPLNSLGSEGCPHPSLFLLYLCPLLFRCKTQ